ncbi:hypothetical protein ACFL5A_02030 [Gemmatimonadota bacterium]
MRLTLLLLLLALPGPLGAQAGPDLSAPPRAGSAVSVFLKGSKIAGESRAHLGGWAGLVFGNRLVVGGGGMALLERVDLAGTVADTGFDLGMGYGGLVLRYFLPLPLGATGEMGLLLGAGNADVRDHLAGRKLGSDNFQLLEPDLAISYPLLEGLFVTGSVGYRLVWGIEDLPTVNDKDLRSLTAALSLRLGGR